ncbi:MAG: DUF2283 domain-containing protein [Rhabdochlamydiaceae bacterium]
MGEKKKVKIWYDAEGDYLEVVFDEDAVSVFRETDNDAVMEMVDESGNLVGFSVMDVSKLSKERPISAYLYPQAA